MANRQWPRANRGDHGESEIRAYEAARERGNDWTRGPREDDVDGGDDEGGGGEGARDLRDIRSGSEGVGVTRQARRDEDPDDRHEPRGVRDGGASLRARGLPRARGLRQEHDHGGGPDGRGDPRGERGGRADAADAGAHPPGAAGERAGDRGLSQQVRSGGRCGAVGPGGAGGAGAAVKVRVPGGRHSGDPGLGPEGDRGGEAVGGEGGGAVGGARKEHPGAEAGGGQAVPDAGGGRVLDHGAGDGGDGADRPGEGEGGGGSGDGGVRDGQEDGGDGGGGVPQAPGRGAGGGQGGEC